MTRTYINQLGNNPGGFLGDLGYNCASMNMMRLVEGDGNNPPGSIIVCYDVSFERRLTKFSDNPCLYVGDPDMSDTLTQETVGGTTYWVLSKCCGNKYDFYPLAPPLPAAGPSAAGSTWRSAPAATPPPGPTTTAAGSSRRATRSATR